MNKYIQKLIQEQFSISDLDFSDDEQEYNAVIFNKNTIDPEKVLDDILYNGNIDESYIKELNDIVYTYSVKVYEKYDLKKIADYYSHNYPEDSLNWLDVSEINDMSCIFNMSNYNGDISRWNVSNVIDMNGMFASSKFNNDISDWDVSSVRNMSWMFFNSVFNGNISKWDVHNVTIMSDMFRNSQFNQDISGWDVSNVENMYIMFVDSPFNQDISGWNVDKVTNYGRLFYNCPILDSYKPKRFM